jgi:tetratricopeptide (TPR) repeat protein
MLVEWVEGRSREDGRMLMFSSAARVDAIRDALDARDAALRLSDNGRRLLRDGRYAEAEKQFVEALQVNPETAFAYVDLARTQLPRGDFKSAAQNARLALRNSADRHVLAAAGDILAVCALFEGDTAKAIGYLRKSASGDPTMPRYDQAARELEDQRWETARVALTAARMSCLEQRADAAAIVLARGNFPSTDAFFAAMETAKTDMQFEHLKARYIKEECH